MNNAEKIDPDSPEHFKILGLNPNCSEDRAIIQSLAGLVLHQDSGQEEQTVIESES